MGTTNPDVAKNYALRQDGSGLVMEVTVPMSNIVASPSAKNVILKNSRSVVNESEVLLRGRVSGASVRKVN